MDRSVAYACLEDLTPEARLAETVRFAGLDADARAQLARPSNLDRATADHMIEHMVTTLAIPVGIATDMIVDGEEVLVPMATEETSIVGFVTDAARRCRATGGFTTSSSGSVMIAQVQVVDLPDPHRARMVVLERAAEIGAICDSCDEILVRFGGAFRGLDAEVLDTAAGPMLAVHLHIDTRDAMGANAVNTMAEAVAPHIEGWTGGRVLLRILTNYAERRLARARATWRPEDVGGAAARDAIVQAGAFAQASVHRAATNNKGIMNGISAVVLATGNDCRAVEAGAHAYAARSGQYGPLTRWEVTPEGDLAGSIELPMAVGTVGGATRTHPTARALLSVTGARTAEQLGRLIAAVGLAQNFAALRVLCTEGIQKGHMARHAANVAIEAGAEGDEVARLVRAMIDGAGVSAGAARRLLAAARSGAAGAAGASGAARVAGPDAGQDGN